MRLISPEIGPDGVLPVRYSCDGEGISPPLKWDGVPATANEFAITCIDPDAPKGPFVHWAIWGLEAYVRELEAGQVPLHSRQGLNGFGRVGYGGACPPQGSPPHHYQFKLYALSRPTHGDLSVASTYETLLAYTRKLVIAEAELIATYERHLQPV